MHTIQSHDSSVCIVSWLRLGRPQNRVRYPAGAVTFLFARTSTDIVASTQALSLEGKTAGALSWPLACNVVLWSATYIYGAVLGQAKGTIYTYCNAIQWVSAMICGTLRAAYTEQNYKRNFVTVCTDIINMGTESHTDKIEVLVE